MVIKAVLFNIETLFNTTNLHYFSLNLALKKYNVEISLDDYLTTFNNLSILSQLQILLNRKVISKKYIKAILNYKEIYFKELTKDICPDQKKIEIFDWLRGKNLKLICLADNKENAKFILKALNLFDYFDLIIEELKMPEEDYLGIEKNIIGMQNLIKNKCKLIMKVETVAELTLDRIQAVLQGKYD